MKLLEPLQIKNIRLKNRVVLPPADTNFADTKGNVTQKSLDYYELRARGGVGLIYIEGTYIDTAGKGTLNMLGIYDDAKIEGLSKLSSVIKNHGASVIIQMFHAGAQASRLITGQQPVTASDVPCKLIGETPRSLSIGEIKKIVKIYGESAIRAKKAGFDGVEIHAAHGYLLNQFLSPRTNKRTDEYGGTLENRMRFLLEVFDETRKQVGNEFLISVRLNGSDYVPGGLEIEETVKIAKRMEEKGADIISITGGIYDDPGYHIIPYMNAPRGTHVKFAASVKKVLKNVPVIAVGRINNPEMAESILQKNQADLIAMARALIADPFFVQKIETNKEKTIIRCIACNNCANNLLLQSEISCAVNPNLFKAENDIETAGEKKKILVVGAGPAGLEAAKIARLRGHDVVVIEKEPQIGGALNIASVAPGKEEIKSLNEYFNFILPELGIELRLNTPLSLDLVKEVNPDTLIVATGTVPLIPDIPGLNEVPYKLYSDVLSSRDLPKGQNIAIIGGGMVGIEVAELLSSKGKQITIIEQMKKLGSNIIQMVSIVTIPHVTENPAIKIHLSTKVKEISGNTLHCMTKDQPITIDFDDLVIATGVKPHQPVSDEIKEIVSNVKVIGDAAKPKKIADAVQKAYKVGLKL
ncbi:MAG: oxidoreductase [Candidatus Helarchaeota archaeon]